MKVNKTKAKLLSGQAVCGTLIYTADPTTVEVVAAAGMDFAVIDTEHSSKDTKTVTEMIRAADAFGITPMVRVRAASDARVLNYIEAGAQGIIFPMLNTVEEAKAANAALRYPPEGNRGNCTTTRNARYGDYRATFVDYQKHCNEQMLFVGLIETAEAVANLPGMLDAGVDVTVLGRVDLASSLGVSGQFEHPKVLEATAQALTAVKAHDGAWPGHIPYNVHEMQDFAAQGYRFFLYSADVYVLRQALQSFADSVPDVAAN